MSKEIKPLWLGPTTMFFGFALLFFGTMTIEFIAESYSARWLDYARTISVIIGGVMFWLGGTWTFQRRDDS